MPFRLANVSGRAALCSETHYFDLERISGASFGPDPMAAIRRAADLHAVSIAGHQPDGDLASASLLAPVPAPTNSFAVGLNYMNHAAESGMDLPAAPLVFTKFPSCITGPNADVQLASAHSDYEAELVVVIGTGGRHIAAADAWSRVAGLTMGQDISDRALQFAAKPPHFDLGKSRETYGPIGPVVVSTDSFADLNDIEVRCWINGEERQHDSTKNLIFSVPKLIEYLSAIMTLHPGDLIFTGTPEGVGAPKGLFLAPGDVIETELAGIGRMTNHCVA
jgi:2,4-didehydro-3-deoxy-L-rhamnonate hydrolase